MATFPVLGVGLVKGWALSSHLPLQNSLGRPAQLSAAGLLQSLSSAELDDFTAQLPLGPQP